MKTSANFYVMRLTIKATNIEHTNAIDAYIVRRLAELEKVLERKEKSEVARVDVGRTSTHHKEGKEIYYAEITFHVKKKDFRAVAKASDQYAAIDKMKDMIVREVTRHHEQARALIKQGGRELTARIHRGS
jgi:ribosomal subunit interface protein